jgi:energy-coupling factor transporter ATP-binding protein EcfA2
MQSNRIVLSEHLDMEEIKRQNYIDSLFENFNSIFIKERRNLREAFTGGDITSISNYEELLYVEPRDYIFGKDYVWEDINKSTGTAESEMQIKGYTNTQELMALVANGGKKGIFLVGDMGCGKTTFVNHFEDIFKKQSPTNVCITIDFLKQPLEINNEADYNQMRIDHFERINADVEKIITANDLSDEYSKYILETATHSVFRKFKIQSNRGETINWRKFEEVRGEWSTDNPLKSISLGFRFLRRKRYNILLVLDNVDVIPGFYQERFARNCLELVDMAEIQVLVTLRFYSFGLAYNVMSGYRWCHIMKIDLPSIRELIEKRIKHFIFDPMDKENYPIKIETGITVTVSKETITELLTYVSENLLQKNLVDFFLKMSDLNIRFILSNYQAILNSQHIKPTADIVYEFFEGRPKFREISSEKSYDLLLKSLISRGEILYNHKSSRVENVFHIYRTDQRDYFPDLLKIYLLRVAYSMSVRHVGTEEEIDFFEKKTLVKKMEKLGWGKAAINDALQELVWKTLFFSYDADSFEHMKRVTLSNMGCLYHNKCYRMVYYIFFMLFDFPISEHRLEKYFVKKEIDEYGEYCFCLREGFKSFLDDDFIHKLVSLFLLEMVDLEKDFIIQSFKRPEALQTYVVHIKEPISFALIDSYIKHLTKAQKQGFDDIIGELSSAKSGLRDAYSKQCKSRPSAYPKT